MKTAWCGIALLLVLPSVAAQQDAGPQLVGEWIREPNAQADVRSGTILVRRGTVRTARLYSDFVFRFEYRQARPAAEGSVLVRSRFGYGMAERGYLIALTSRLNGVDALGRISGAGAGMKEMQFTPAQPASSSGTWQECEIRAERGKLTVSVNQRIVSAAERLDEFTGYIALQARRGDGIEFRNIRAERLPSTGDPFGQGAHWFNEPGVMLPRAIKTAKPFYPKEQHDAWLQGVVSLELVVDPAGSLVQ